MAKTKKKYWLLLSVFFFLLYIFLAAQPIPQETTLVARWLTSFESGFPIGMDSSLQEENSVIPFQLGNRFGFAEDNGQFIMNRIQREANLSLSAGRWSEYEAMPSSLEIFDPRGSLLMTVNAPGGYPLFLDNRTFIAGNEQNSISRLDSEGNIKWTYDFPAILTCVDAASGFLLAGTLDGALELLDDSGRQILSFEPGGSRLAVTLGCAISRDGTKLAVVSGIDNQRFLLLEQSGESFRVVYHEFLGAGFRRAVHINFIDNDGKVAYEREGGVGIYDIQTRTNVTVPLDGEITAMDYGDDNYLFLVTSRDRNRKRLTGIKLPGLVILDAPFRSESAFLERRNSKIYLGGDNSFISFGLGKK